MEYDHQTNETGRIAVGNTVDDPEGLFVDPNRPVMIFAMNSFYSAARRRKLVAFYRDVLPAYGKPEATQFTRANEAQRPAIALKRYLDETGETVEIPTSTYHVAVGRFGGYMDPVGLYSADPYRLDGDKIIKLR